jgi:hypothetical protein
MLLSLPCDVPLPFWVLVLSDEGACIDEPLSAMAGATYANDAAVKPVIANIANDFILMILSY